MAESGAASLRIDGVKGACGAWPTRRGLSPGVASGVVMLVALAYYLLLQGCGVLFPPLRHLSTFKCPVMRSGVTPAVTSRDAGRYGLGLSFGRSRSAVGRKKVWTPVSPRMAKSPVKSCQLSRAIACMWRVRLPGSCAIWVQRCSVSSGALAS
jgi:hypothetical protein